MTTGQRIAAKRKELNLSQEALGESLNVSRQSIYKWESDASLPEIDKLVALSRLFRVSVGWLLGVEEETETPASQSGELTEAQLKLVEEILHRYQQAQQRDLSEEQQAQVEAMVAAKLAAQPKPKKRRWPWVLAGAALVIALFSLFEQLERVDDQYTRLSNSIHNFSSDVNSQIGGITNRVEEILKSQNALTADYGTQIASADLARNTITFSARVVPKTYVEGMEVLFLADDGNGLTELAGTMGVGREFTAEITCELTDHIVLSAVFVTDGVRQTQLLDTYEGLYGASLPYVDITGFESAFAHEEVGEDGLFHFREEIGWLHRYEPETKLGEVELQSVQLGLFRNFELVTWAEPIEKPGNYTVEGEQFFRLPALDIALEAGDLIHCAVFFTDQYGRTGVTPCYPISQCTGDEVGWISTSGNVPYDTLSNYILNPKS